MNRLFNWVGKLSRSRDMTTGKAASTILSFAIPVMVGNLLQQIYSMVDTAVVGRAVGTSALAAVGATAPVTQLILGLMIGMTSGMSVIIAQYFGAGKREQTKSAITNGIYLITGISLAVTFVGMLSCEGLLRFINTPEDIIDGAVLYAAIIFAGTVSQAAYNYETSILRALGNSVIPLLFLLLASVLNVVLDLVFVLCFSWGIFGVGVATVISQCVSAVFCFFYIRKYVPEAKFSKADWKWNGSIVKEHIRTGIPMAFFSSLLAISFLLLQSALNALGSADVAAYTAGSKMDTLVYQILGAFGTAISTFAAQNYGKGEMDRVREGVRKTLLITIAISLGLTAFVFLFGRYFMLLFVGANEAEVLTNGLLYMRTTSLFYLILGVNFVVRFALTGVGKSAVPMMVGITEILTRAAVTYFLIYRIGFAGITFASPSCWFTSTLLCVICYAPMMKSAVRTYQRKQQKTRSAESI